MKPAVSLALISLFATAIASPAPQSQDTIDTASLATVDPNTASNDTLTAIADSINKQLDAARQNMSSTSTSTRDLSYIEVENRDDQASAIAAGIASAQAADAGGSGTSIAAGVLEAVAGGLGPGNPATAILNTIAAGLKAAP